VGIAIFDVVAFSAILHHALGDKCPTVGRPKGSKGRERTDFLWPDDAFPIIGKADEIDAEFGLYLRMLLYTGIRKGEGLDLLSANVRPDDQAAWLQTSKNEDPRMLKLREDIVAPLRLHLEKAGDHLFPSTMAAISSTISPVPVAFPAPSAGLTNGRSRHTG
jgi:integrase